MSLTRTYQIKCDRCGKFISINDLIAGSAWHVLVSPDSEFSQERYESQCSSCCKAPIV